MILLVLALGGWCVTLNSNLQDDQLIVGRKYVYPSNYQQSGYVGSWEPWWQCHDGTINFVKWFGWIKLHILSAAFFRNWMDIKSCTIIGVGLVWLYYLILTTGNKNYSFNVLTLYFVLGGKESGYFFHTFYEFLALKGFSSIKKYQLS